MLSCLSLVHHSHVRIAADGGQQHTACGMSVADQFVEPGLFAEEAGAATCVSCRRASAPHGRDTGTATSSPPQPKAALRLLFERINDPCRADGLAALLGGGLADRVSEQRLQRLHELFPGWRATIRDLIAEGTTALARYRVDCVDTCGLTGSTGPLHKTDQAVIFRFSDHRITQIEAIVDDFGLWAEC
ncbi:MAG TPA: nuclear transport factor 2 family protein [Pseudonocardiaceae bacterium]|jgi:hypothetical protein|nr:nuclear transport factor 2 family protein [Pseudonocardiaceae bacterium]